MGNSFNVVRAANILNKEYFSDELIGNAIRSLKTVMDPGGIFIVVRTHADRSNHGSIYLNDKNFQSIGVIGDGSEIDHVVKRI